MIGSTVHAGAFYPAQSSAVNGVTPSLSSLNHTLSIIPDAPSHPASLPLATATAHPSSSLSSSAILQVPRLSDLCRRILKANIAHIQDVGDVSYDLLRDILPGCRVDQLRDIEELSPHIADDDEEIWEFYFKRDFPIVAEARATAAAAASSQETNSASPSKLSAARPAQCRSPALDQKSQDMGEEDGTVGDEENDLFVSYRDLYYDEQLRREERLATAGERLKARLNNIAQQKSSRQTILDPRLSQNLRKRRKGITLPTGRGAPPPHWSRGEARPKTLAEKARIKAGQIALGLGPHRLTRNASAAVGLIHQRPRPIYKEPSLEEDKTRQLAVPVKGIFGPRRTVPNDRTAARLGSAAGDTEGTAHPHASVISSTGTRFVERTVPVAAKSSVDRPHKASTSLAGPAPIPSTRTSLPIGAKDPTNNGRASPVPPRKAIPGITRKVVQPPKVLDKESAKPAAEVPIEAVRSPDRHAFDHAPASPIVASGLSASPPPPARRPEEANLPMFTQPKRLPPGPSLFMPRKKRKVA